jgi:adenine-specific DNA-methyltransferase
MARIHELVDQIKALDSGLAEEISNEVKALSDRREFGLNFERHTPEQVELPGRPVRKGDKVHILAPRGETSKSENKVMWVVMTIDRDTKMATLRPHRGEAEQREVSLDDLVVVAEFRDPIYPGLVSTGKVELGGDKPFHTVINAENFHALEALLFTHRGKADVIYIDPPYNTGARDWKYNNDYVESEDSYRHSKWLAFMERRLLLAKELLNEDDSVLVVSIDEKEYLRLGLLLEQTFPDATVQMISSVINSKGVSRGVGFRRTDEYVFFVMIGSATPERLELGPEWSSSGKVAKEVDTEILSEPGWITLMRTGTAAARSDRPSMFYPIYVDPKTKRIAHVGDFLPAGIDEAPQLGGLVSVLPLRSNGAHGRWQVSSGELKSRIEQGRVRSGGKTSYGYVIQYLPEGAYKEVMSGTFQIEGIGPDGSLIALGKRDSKRVAPTQWKIVAHDASVHGSTLLTKLIPNRKFPFPKSLYAVEDALRFFVASKPNATIIDFFSGSGTTAHAVMRLNKQDGGRRTSISVTNNEVSYDEQINLIQSGLRPGDADWEKLGICDYITKPRIQAAIEGKSPEGQELQGEYKFTDPFPMRVGFQENAEFFTLTYENSLEVMSGRNFDRIAPLLWLRAGSEGERIESLNDGWAATQKYAVLRDLDKLAEFLEAIATKENLSLVFIFTDEDRLFETIAREIPTHIELIRMFDAYFRNAEFEALAVTR